MTQRPDYLWSSVLSQSKIIILVPSPSLCSLPSLSDGATPYLLLLCLGPCCNPLQHHHGHAQPSPPQTDNLVNCGNEGHSGEQLEMLSVPTTITVGEPGPDEKLTRRLEDAICSPPTTQHHGWSSAGAQGSSHRPGSGRESTFQNIFLLVIWFMWH